jgi:hypothetical protein
MVINKYSCTELMSFGIIGQLINLDFWDISSSSLCMLMKYMCNFDSFLTTSFYFSAKYIHIYVSVCRMLTIMATIKINVFQCLNY